MIVHLGTKVLHQKVEPIPLSKEGAWAAIQDTFDEMEYWMDKLNGIGIAANQIGSPLRLCIITTHDGKLIKMVNPRKIFTSYKEHLGIEGCLSLPGKAYKVKRASTLVVAYLDEKGLPDRLTLEGRDAVVAQHELDHLEGKLICDVGKEVVG